MNKKMSKLYKLISQLGIGVLFVTVTTAAFAIKLDQPITASRVVDLSQQMYDEMPFWPGGVPFKKEKLVDYDQGYQLHKFSMGENTGTHIDAPSHFIKGKWSISDLPLNKLILPIAIINVQTNTAKNADYQLTPEDILRWESVHGKVPAGALVIMNTGWYKKFTNSAAYINQDEQGVMHFPGFSLSAAKLLIKRDVAAIGIDTLSLDYGMSKDFASHVEMLKNNKYQIENMTNLDVLPATGATAIVGVLPVREGSQAQARILALLP